jgi:hypothetical protein
LTIQKVNADEQDAEPILIQYDIRSIPTMIMLDPEGNELDKRIGEMSAKDLDSWATNLMAEYSDKVNGPCK